MLVPAETLFLWLGIGVTGGINVLVAVVLFIERQCRIKGHMLRPTKDGAVCARCRMPFPAEAIHREEGVTSGVPAAIV
jgi:hypothetical protein